MSLVLPQGENVAAENGPRGWHSSTGDRKMDEILLFQLFYLYPQHGLTVLLFSVFKINPRDTAVKKLKSV